MKNLEELAEEFEENLERNLHKKTITLELHNWLGKKPRTREELAYWICKHGSWNTLRHFNDYDKLRKLVNKVFKKASKK